MTRGHTRHLEYEQVNRMDETIVYLGELLIKTVTIMAVTMVIIKIIGEIFETIRTSITQ